MQQQLLMIEDDTRLAQMVSEYLERSGFGVVHAADAKTGLHMLEDPPSGATPDLLVLDLMLPDIDGLEVCRRVRSLPGETGKVPVLMLTAKGDPMDRIVGLELGADDYLPKPFDIQELLARVRALLRRDKMHKARIIKVADLTIDTAQHLVRRGDDTVRLSVKEYELLEALAAHESQVLTRDVIQDRVWMDEETYSNTVDVYINMLRKKIDAGHDVKLIHTVRGVGYTLRADAGTP
jgi:DNA-binding response OmpR family regulator